MTTNRVGASALTNRRLLGFAHCRPFDQLQSCGRAEAPRLVPFAIPPKFIRLWIQPIGCRRTGPRKGDIPHPARMIPQDITPRPTQRPTSRPTKCPVERLRRLVANCWHAEGTTNACRPPRDPAFPHSEGHRRRAADFAQPSAPRRDHGDPASQERPGAAGTPRCLRDLSSAEGT